MPAKKELIPMPLGLTPARGDSVESSSVRNTYASLRMKFKNVDTDLKYFNKVKKYTQIYEGKTFTPLSITLYFESVINPAQVLNREITLNTITNPKTKKLDVKMLRKEIGRIMTEESDGGSDVFFEEYELDMQRITFNYKTKVKPVGNAKGQAIFHPFQTEDLGNYEDGLCGWKCFQFIDNYNITKINYSTKHLRYVKNIVAYIQEKSIPVSIIEATPNIKTITRPFDVNTKNHQLWKLAKEDFNPPNYIYKSNIENYTLVYSHKYMHYDVCKEINYKENLYMTQDGIFYEKNEKDRHYYPCKKQETVAFPYMMLEDNDYKKEKQPDNIHYIFLDIETVRDYNDHDINIPYSCSLTVMDNNDLERLDNLENKYKENKKLDLTEEINFIIRKNCHMFVGYDCLDKVLDYIEDNQDNKKFIIYTFNGANFDHYLMYKYSLNRKNNPVIKPPVMAGGQMLQFSLYDVHIFKDIRKYTGGSLKGNCEGYQINLFSKKDGFSHYEVQQQFNNGKLEEWLTINEKKLFEYNTYDTLALALLYYRVRNALENAIESFNKTVPEGEKEIRVDNNMTLGMFMKAVFTKHTTTSGIMLPKFSTTTIPSEMAPDEKEQMLEFYNDMSKHRIGGRCELFNGDQHIQEHIVSLDVCSLYPYVMFCADNYYPTGIAIECMDYDKLPKKKIGFFYCDVDQSEMAIPFIPHKDEAGNNWKPGKLTRVLLDNISIKYLIDNNAKVDIYEGYYYSKTEKGIKLFSFLADIMKKKNEQDTLKANKDEKYNPALRETYKLCLNILSGKLNQGLSLDKLQFMNDDEYEKHVISKGKEYPLNSIALGPRKKILVSYKKTEEECLSKASPIQIGTMIYVYARKFMHEHMYNRCNPQELIYTDTDSNKLRVREFEQWVKNYGSKTIVPHCKEIEAYDPRYKSHLLYQPGSKVFGSFEDEYAKMKITESFFLQKKFYFINTEDPQQQKIHCKGMSPNDIVLPDDFDESTNINIREEIRNTKKYNSIVYKSISDNPKEFYEDLFINRQAKVLTFGMKKHYGNLKKNVDISDYDNMNKLYANVSVVYPIKNITLKESP